SSKIAQPMALAAASSRLAGAEACSANTDCWMAYQPIPRLATVNSEGSRATPRRSGRRRCGGGMGPAPGRMAEIGVDIAILPIIEGDASRCYLRVSSSALYMYLMIAL